MPAGSYLDTSFLRKLYVQEPDSPKVISWFTENRHPVFISQLTEIEMASSIHRQYPISKASQIYSDFKRDVSLGLYQRLDIDESVLRVAERFGEQYGGSFGLRALDAVQLAVAVHHSIQEIATFDDRLARAAQAAGLKRSV